MEISCELKAALYDHNYLKGHSLVAVYSSGRMSEGPEF